MPQGIHLLSLQDSRQKNEIFPLLVLHFFPAVPFHLVTCVLRHHIAAAYLQSLPTPPPPLPLPHSRCCSLLFCVINFRFSGSLSRSSPRHAIPKAKLPSSSFPLVIVSIFSGRHLLFLTCMCSKVQSFFLISST